MPKLPRWAASDAERALLSAGFEHLSIEGQPRDLRQRPVQGNGAVRRGAVLDARRIDPHNLPCDR